MTAADVLEILDGLTEQGLRVWVDGGWGVDALVGRQSRPHDDLDLIARLDEDQELLVFFAARGYALDEDERPTRLVVRHEDGRNVDFHFVTFDAEGGGVQEHQDGSTFRYPPEGFTKGRIAGRSVPCVSAKVQMLCHRGYAPDAKDVHDVHLLARTFDLPLPPEYRKKED